MTTYKSIAELLSELIIGSIVYLFITIFAGYFEARIAKKLGDRTAEHEGFLSLNPMVYIDWLGFFFFLLSGFGGMLRIGWGQPVPINPHNFTGKYKKLELLFAYYSGVMSLCLVGLCVLLITVFFLGGYTLSLPMLSILSAHSALSQAMFAVVSTTITYSFFYALFMFVVASIRFILLSQKGHDLQTMMNAEFYSRFITLFVVFVFGRPLSIFMLFMINTVEWYAWEGWRTLATFLGFISWYT